MGFENVVNMIALVVVVVIVVLLGFVLLGFVLLEEHCDDKDGSENFSFVYVVLCLVVKMELWPTVFSEVISVLVL